MSSSLRLAWLGSVLRCLLQTWSLQESLKSSPSPWWPLKELLSILDNTVPSVRKLWSEREQERGMGGERQRERERERERERGREREREKKESALGKCPSSTADQLHLVLRQLLRRICGRLAAEVGGAEWRSNAQLSRYGHTIATGHTLEVSEQEIEGAKEGKRDIEREGGLEAHCSRGTNYRSQCRSQPSWQSGRSTCGWQDLATKRKERSASSGLLSHNSRIWQDLRCRLAFRIVLLSEGHTHMKEVHLERGGDEMPLILGKIQVSMKGVGS